MTPKKIALLGYMGSGKSAIGSALAGELQLPFFDLDTLIEETTGASVQKLFAKKGELFFRKQEAEILEEFLNTNDQFILATGGGTPCYGNNLLFLEKNEVFTLYLQTPIPVLAQRLKKEKAHRPLISHLDDHELLEFIGKHIFERSAYYTQAKHHISCGEKSVDQIVDEIREALI